MTRFAAVPAFFLHIEKSIKKMHKKVKYSLSKMYIEKWNTM